jgi:predicted oxidoreductase
LRTLGRILSTGHDHSWFILTQSIIENEFALSGSEQNPDLTAKGLKLTASRIAPGAPGPVEAFKQHGVDFVVRDNLRDLVEGMNRIARGPELEFGQIERQIVARDREVWHQFSKRRPADGCRQRVTLPRRQVADRAPGIAYWTPATDL